MACVSPAARRTMHDHPPNRAQACSPDSAKADPAAVEAKYTAATPAAWCARQAIIIHRYCRVFGRRRLGHHSVEEAQDLVLTEGEPLARLDGDEPPRSFHPKLTVADLENGSPVLQIRGSKLARS